MNKPRAIESRKGFTIEKTDSELAKRNRDVRVRCQIE